MVGLPTIADTFRCALKWSHTNGQTAVNVMHIHAPTKTPADVASGLDANVTAAMWGFVNVGASVNELQVTKLDGSSATYLLAVSGAKWTGGTTSGDFTPALAMCVSARTGLRGRRNRGRLYLPYISESVASNGSASSAVTSCQSAWDTFLSTMTAAGLTPCIASYGFSQYRKGTTVITNTWTPTQNAITKYTVESILATQRRRQGRLRV